MEKFSVLMVRVSADEMTLLLWPHVCIITSIRTGLEKKELSHMDDIKMTIFFFEVTTLLINKTNVY